MYSARAARYTYTLGLRLEEEGWTRDWLFDYHVHLQNEIAIWNEKQSKYLNVIAFSEWIFEKTFFTQLFGDFGLVASAIVLIFVYANIVLGSCSPIYLRSLSAIIGLSCVILSVISGYAIASTIGCKASVAHNILPFMLLGIGVDDMFVIVSCID